MKRSTKVVLLVLVVSPILSAVVNGVKESRKSPEQRAAERKEAQRDDGAELARAAAAGQVPAYLADSWAKCQEELRVQFGRKVAISFGPDKPTIN